MTRDDIIRMALKCGATIKSDCEGNGVFGDGIDLLQFAALVYPEAHKDGLDDFEAAVLPAAIAAEREACAQTVASIAGDEQYRWAAMAIRERGAP